MKSPILCSMKDLLKKIILFCAFVPSSLIFLTNVYKEIAYRFCLSNICYEKTNFRPKEFISPSPNEEVLAILNQKFHYLGQGNQSYAFESEDSKYVLKFFKFGHLKPFSLPIPFLQEHFKAKAKSQEKRFLKVFEGYKIAYTEDPENSALLFIHLNKRDHLKKELFLRDRFGIAHTINLNDVAFVLQEKVIPTKEVFKQLFKQQDIEGVKRRIGQLFDLYIAQYKKGLYDRDHNLMYNTGFKGKKAIRLDVGKLRKEPFFKEPANYRKDLEKIAFERILRWVKKYYPDYENEITLTLMDLLANVQ